MTHDRQAYLAGGGIAGLAAAALLIREGGFRGDSIHVLEASDRFGGSLDGAGDAQSGYVSRGGRMFEAHFGCTYDLFASIPSLTSDGLSVRDEIHAFNRGVASSSKSRLVDGGRKQEAPTLGLSFRDKWDLARLTLVIPLLSWLREAGVDLQSDTAVTDIRFAADEPKSTVTAIALDGERGPQQIDIGEQDLVLITLGSMTADSSLGSMDEAPRSNPQSIIGSWPLWRMITAHSEPFGRPQVFCDDVEKSSWESFTVTLDDPTFFAFMEQFTDNRAGTGGLITIKDSNWLLSLVLPHQPHFLDQPGNLQVFWGYGLNPGQTGNHVKKPMSVCSGKEILQELLFHLPVGEADTQILAAANCIPCMMPFITSQFMPRSAGDRPAVIPVGARNFAFLEQFCEVADDTVFTVEYSVRTAQTAVSGLLGLPRAVTPIYRGDRDLGVVLRALRALG
jgi:oleate hydratase